jgi:mannosylglucosylglycerate synthase
MNKLSTAFLHYSAPPVVGGVEAVMAAHAKIFLRHGYPVTLIAGEGEESALPRGTQLVVVPEMSTQNSEILAISAELEQGNMPDAFAPMKERIQSILGALLSGFDRVIIHNIFTKHFNLPLTAALVSLQEEGTLPKCLAWCHDLTWTSAASRKKVFPGYPWDLLRTYQRDFSYITISQLRQAELAGMLDIEPEKIDVIYNGVDPWVLFGLSAEGQALADRMGLMESDLVTLMPVRVTRAKNIEFAMQVTRALKEAGVHSPRFILTGPPDPHSAENMSYFHELLELRSMIGVEEEFRFIYMEQPAGEGLILPAERVGELYRMSDLVFLPSLREGFGMPVTEGGLLGIPVATSEHVPAAWELGKEDVLVFGDDITPARAARQVLRWIESLPMASFKRRVRASLTWDALFKEKIAPHLKDGK